MIRKVSIASALALIAAAGAASARSYSGSDTLKVFTQTLVTQCGAVGGGTTFPALAGTSSQFTYIGGGSGQGGTDMKNGEQDIAPQSRPINASEACETVIEANPSTGSGNLGNDETAVTVAAGAGAEGLVVGLDGMSIAVSPASGARCDPTPADTFAAPLAFDSTKTFPVTNFTTNVPDGAPNINTFTDVPLPAAGSSGLETVNGVLSYRFADFKDVLRILFAGADKTRTVSTAAGGGGGSSQTAANRLSRCSSDIRRSLVSNWDNIVEANPTTCTGAASCGTLRRLFRRADDSGTTDTFLSLLGLNAIAQVPFCNGVERQDQDPIRRTCLPDDDVCGATNLGLVLAVEEYQLQNVSQARLHAAWYPTTPCAQGVFVLRDAPILPGGGSATTCPDGAPQILGQCLTPQSGPATATGTAVGGNCLNGQLNTSFLTPGGNDGRAWNKELRSSAGNMRNELIAGQTVPTGVTNAFHRTRSRVGGTAGQCLFDDATETIGCLAGNMACALGYAGREATDNPITSPIAVAALVNNVAPTVQNIQALVNPTLGTAYPLARKLYFNSILGFDAIRDEVNTPSANDAEQEQLIRCIEQQAAPHQAALTAAGFIPVPALPAGAGVAGHIVEFRTGASGIPGLICEDANEVTLCGAASDAPNCILL
jgi:hypothetical protein